MSGTLPATANAVARAIWLTAYRHFAAALGSRTRVFAVAGVLLALTIAGNVIVGIQFHAALADVLSTSAVPPRQRADALGLLIVTTSCTSAALALLTAMLMPQNSFVSVTARIAGASRRAVALGEFVPSATAAIATLAMTGAGIVVIIAGSQQAPLPTGIAVVATALGFAFAAALLRNSAIALLQLARVHDVAARSSASLLAMLGLGALLASVLASALGQRTSPPLQALSWLWGQWPVPTSWTHALLTTGCAVALGMSAAITAALTGSRQPLTAGWRLFPLHWAGSPRRFAHFVLGEVLLLLRHPVSVVSAATLAALIVGGVVAVHRGLVPAPLMATAFAVLCAGGAETACGRTRPWSWLALLTGRSAAHRVLAQITAILVVQGVVFVAAIALITPATGFGSEFRSLMAATTPLFGVLTSLAYLAGVLIPYSEQATLSSAATTALVICLEVGWLFVESAISPLDGLVHRGLQAFAAGAAIGAAVILVRRADLRPAAGVLGGGPT